jgi:hypothetical protein
MQKQSSPSTQLTKRRAAFRLRQLLDEFHLLMGSFPDLEDAFDPDELPLAFILRRDSRLTDDGVKSSTTSSQGASKMVRRRTIASRAQSRNRRRKQISDE